MKKKTVRKKETVDMKDFGSKHVDFAKHVTKLLGLPYPEAPVKPKDMDDEKWIRAMQIPLYLSKLTSAQLSTKLSLFTQVSAYATVKLSEAEIRTSEFKRRREAYIQDRLSSVSGRTLTEKKAKIKAQGSYIDIELIYYHAKAVESNVRALLTGYDRKYQAISREISLREKEDPRQRRAARKGGA